MIKNFIPLFYQTQNSSAVYTLNENVKSNAVIDFPLKQNPLVPVILTKNVYSEDSVYIPSNKTDRKNTLPQVKMPNKLPISSYDIDINPMLMEIVSPEYKKLIDII